MSSLETLQNSLNSAIGTYFYVVEHFGANSPQAASSLASVNGIQKQVDETYQFMLAANMQAAEQESARLLAERQAAVDKENARIAAEQEAARVAAQQEAARVAAQQEAARIAAQQEAARIAAQQEAARVEAARAEAAAQEAARIAAQQEAARVAAQQEAARVEAARVAAQQEAARVAAQQEAARVEAARVAAQVGQAPPSPPPEVTEGIANNLMYRSMTSGVPTSEFDKYGGYEAVRAKSTLAATPKAIGEYERAMGLPESEYTKVNKEYAASGKSEDTIVSEITALVPASGSITYESLVNYANNNNLPFQSVANALEGKFKDTTPQQIVDSLNYEDDRLALNRLATTKKVDGKDVTSVDLADAIKAASQGLVSPENLAKFFGKTPAEMASFVSSNLDYIADNLRDNGIDPSKSLNSMFGIAADKVTQSINKIDIQEGLNALVGTDGKINFDAALDYAKTKNLSNDELAGYLGVTPKAITDYVKDLSVRSGLNALADPSGKITYDAALEFADDRDMTIDELATYLGVNANTITEYKTDKELNQLKTFVNGVLTSEDKNIGEQAASIKTYLQQNKLSEKDLASATGYSDAQVSRLLNPISREQAIQNYLKSSDATGLYELDAALAGSAYDRSRFNEIPEADKQAFISAYTKAGGTSAGALAEIANLYQPGMTTQQLVGSVIDSRQSDAEAAANTVFLDVSGKPITGENVSDLYRISSFVGYDPATGTPIRAVGSSQGQYFYDPDAGSRVATLLDNQRKFEQAGGKFGTFIEGTDIPYGETGAQSIKDYPQATPTSTVATVNDQVTPVIDYKSPIYIQAFTQGIMKRTDLTDAQKATEINNYKNQYGVTDEQLAGATGYTVQQFNDFLSPKTTTEAILDGLKTFADKDGKITFDAALEYANANKVPIADVAKAINVTPEALTKYSTDKQISAGLQTASGSDNQLSYDEILNYADANNVSLDDIVKYIGTADKQPELLEGLQKYAADKPIIEGLQTAAGQDNQLSYSEIVDFASKNNMDLSNVVNYIGTEDKRSDLLTSLQNYVKEEGFKSSLNDTKLTDYKGNQYAANDLLKLADQVKQNFDTKNSSGGVYKTSGESVGFDYSEAKKLFPEGKNPTVFDQVALDIARGLLNAGIKDVSELSRYKPTEVTELDYNVEAGPPTETKVTKLINPETGEEAPNLGATYTGKGGTVYNFTVDASGKPVFGTEFTDTSDKGQIATLVAMGAAFLAPQILPQLIGSAPAAVAGVEGAVAQAALGGTGLTGSLMAAGIPASVAGYASTAIVNGVYNGLVSEVTGGDFEKGFITGGVAPVMGQLTANAVNSITTGLPAGVSSAVGNAVTQLISTGEIDLGQMALAGVKPTVIGTIVDASGGALTAPQARLLLETVASGGKNITSLAQNPAGVVNFVLRNQDAFKNLSTAAATNTAQKPPAVDLSGLDTVQKEVLTSTPRTETIQGEALFKDINETELGSGLATTGIVRPPGEMISTDMSKPVTGVDEFAGYDNALQFAQALISGDPAALAKMAGTAGEDTGVGQLANKDAIAQIREAQRTGALDYYNLNQAQLEAMLIDRAPTLEQAREMAELAYGKGASFRYGGKFYEGSGTPLSQAVQIKDSSGKVFDVPANATLNKNSSGAVVGYTHNGTTYEYQNGKMVPLASTALPEKYTLEDVRKLSLDGLTKLYESIDPNAHKQTTIPGTGQVVTPYQAWLVRYGKNPEAAVAELNATAPVKDASILQTISKNIGNVVQELRSSDNSYVRSVGDKLATNATYLGEAVKGAAVTLSSPVELFNAIAFGDPTNPISQWASGVRSDITAAQAAVDPDWQKTKSFINEQLTKIGADQGQIAQFVAGADLYANNPRALGDFFWSTVPTAIPGVAAYSALTRFGVPIAYAGGAFAAATGSQTDLVPMADATYQNLLEQVKRDNPNISERDAQERAAAGTAVSMRAAGLISLAGSTAIQLLPGTQAGGILAKAVTREIGQEIGDESWVKVLSNAWQGKDLQTDMGRTVLEAVLASGPISTAANLLTNQYGTTYNQDQVVRDLNWELENATPTFNQGVKVLTGPNNQPILNSANQPILLTYDQKPGLTFDEDPNKPGPSPTELNKSSPTESIFDVIFDNEQNGGYYVNSVSLDGKSYTVTDKDGSTKVINTDQLLNNALNIVTQQDPDAYQTLLIDNPLEALLSDQIARNVDLGAINQNNQLANIITTNQNGAFAITDSGTITFVPNKLANVDTKIDFQIGDSVVIGQGLALPVKKEVATGGQVTYKPDSSLDLGLTFGPIFTEVKTNTGTALVNTTAPNVLTGTVVSIDPNAQTALVSANTGSPFLVNLFGFNPTIGSNLFFNASTGDVIGTSAGQPIIYTPPADVVGYKPIDIPVTKIGNVPTIDTPIINTPSGLPPPITPPPAEVPPVIINTFPPPPPPETPPTITPPTTDLVPPGGVPPIDLVPPTGGVPPVDLQIPTVGVPDTTIKTATVPTGGGPVVTPPPSPPPVIPPVVTPPPPPPPWELPVVPPPELSGSFQMPYPNYLRPLNPYLPYGIGALMGDLYDEVSRDGGYQPFQNAQGQIKIPT